MISVKAMEPSSGRPAIQVRIPQLLEEIRYLASKRDALLASGDGKAASRLISSEILRKFGLIDWILVLEDRKHGQVTTEESAALDLCKALVQAVKEELRATPEDVKTMPISPIRQEHGRRHNGGSFEYYLQLPGPIVRERILSNLTSLEDKLNLIKAIPSEGSMMGWDEGNLQLQVIFPILMKRKVLDWRSLHTLTLLNSEVKGWVTDFLENRTLSDLRYYWPDQFDSEADVTSLNDLLDKHNESCQEWNEGLNPSTEVHLNFCRSTVESEDARLRSVLDPLGENIWSSTIFLKGSGMTATQLLARIKNVLARTPNLRNLHLETSLSFGRNVACVPISEEHRKANEKMELPPMPSLKSLRFDDFNDYPHLVAIGQKLQDTYAPQLEHLYFYPDIPWTSGKFSFPLLTTLNVVHFRVGVDTALQILASFVDSPLQALDLYIEDVDARSRLPNLLRFLSTHFGGTLECLKLQLGCVGRDTVRPPPTPPPSSTWMLDVSFPKLNYFGMDDFPQPGDFSFLLCFPALEKLYFESVENPREAIFEEETVLQLSFKLEKMFASNIWSIFPALRIYDVNGCCGDIILDLLDDDTFVHCGVTREECAIFRRDGTSFERRIIKIE